MHPLRIGVVGCGRAAADFHLPALRSLPGIEVAAVADVDRGRLGEVADRFGIRERHGSVQALLEGTPVDAVAVLVPARFHAEVALAVLDARKHLFVEKPVALTLDESDLLLERAAGASVVATVGFNMRWHRLIRRARDEIAAGSLGAPELVRSVIAGPHRTVPAWRERRALGGGVLFEQAVHHFDLWRFLLGTEVEEVFALTRSELRDDETAVVGARLANGALASCAFTQRAGTGNEVDVYGVSARLQVSCHRFDGFSVSHADSPSGSVIGRIRRAGRLLGDSPQAALAIRRGGDWAASYRAEWAGFLDAVRRGSPVGSSLEDGRRALEIVLAAAESSSLGRPVALTRRPGTT